ncbi:MAG: hypothetical protein GY845_08000 [Planctomycetes bacterium]|nr:hypothetical protein [Planctomycetota bacterium]
MKRLIVTIIAAIMTISLSGCSFVREYHRGHSTREVIVTAPPRHRPVRHVPVRHKPHHRPVVRRHVERRHHPSSRRWHD